MDVRRTSTLAARFSKIPVKKRQLLVVTLVAIIVLIAVFLIVGSLRTSGRSESYKKISGGAGLEATINYDCKKDPCFDFNIYMLNDSGQQVAVVRPDKHGKVNMALPEGDYVMVIGKRDKDGLFPQEPVALKNGQSLELKLQYKEMR